MERYSLDKTTSFIPLVFKIYVITSFDSKSEK